MGSSENTAQESERLQRLAEELEQSVKGFKIAPERVALDNAELNSLPRGLGVKHLRFCRPSPWSLFLSLRLSSPGVDYPCPSLAVR